MKDYYSLLHGDQPNLRGFASFEEEIDFIQSKIQELTEDVPYESISLVARTNQLVERYRDGLKQYNIPSRRIRSNDPDDQSLPGVRVMTMHRVKGLQFEHMFLASVNQGVIPLEFVYKDLADETAINNFLQQERSLLHVAATRAKKSVTITYHGNPSPFLDI